MSQSGSLNGGGGGAGLTWNQITVAGPTAMVSNNGYVANAAVLVQLTLPAAANFGDTISVCGKGAGLYQIQQNAGQQIHYGNLSTTVGVGGSITATQQRDTIEILCTTTNTEWTVQDSVGIHNVV